MGTNYWDPTGLEVHKLRDLGYGKTPEKVRNLHQDVKSAIYELSAFEKEERESRAASLAEYWEEFDLSMVFKGDVGLGEALGENLAPIVKHIGKQFVAGEIYYDDDENVSSPYTRPDGSIVLPLHQATNSPPMYEILIHEGTHSYSKKEQGQQKPSLESEYEAFMIQHLAAHMLEGKQLPTLDKLKSSVINTYYKPWLTRRETGDRRIGINTIQNDPKYRFLKRHTALKRAYEAAYASDEHRITAVRFEGARRVNVPLSSEEKAREFLPSRDAFSKTVARKGQKGLPLSVPSSDNRKMLERLRAHENSWAIYEKAFGYNARYFEKWPPEKPLDSRYVFK